MNDEVEDVNYAQIEKEILEEHNKLRTEPKSYITVLENHLTMFKGDVFTYPGKIGIRTREGVSAVNEAIKFLKEQKALNKLTLDPSICKAAKDHADDTGPKGLTGHDGSDGSSMSDRVERYCKWTGGLAENIDYGIKAGQMVVLSLLTDDGVKSRGHRKNLFNEKIKYVGISCGYHEKYGMLSVCDYANGVEVKSVISSEVTNKICMVRNIDEINQKMQKMNVSPSKNITVKKFEETKQEKYNMSTDPDCPKGAVSASVKVSSKTSNGKTTTITTKTYTMKDGSKKTVEVTSTSG
jgi:uncharacterized protein YkwD